MSKRKSNHDHDDFFLAAKADADEDREVRQAQEAKDVYKKQKKEYDQKKKEYDREFELWKIANDNGQIMDPPMKPKKPKPPAKESDIHPADLEKRENIFKLARSKWGGQLRAQDRKNLMSLLGIECKTDLEGIIHVICPQRWLRDSYRLSDTKGLPSITSLKEPEPSTSAHGFNLSRTQREIKMAEEKERNKKIKNNMDWESEFFGKGKGKQKESSKTPESDSDSDSSDTIPCSNITSTASRRTIKKEDSDVESDEMPPSRTSFRPGLQLQKKDSQIKQDIESDSDGDLPSNTSLKPSFISQTRHPIKKENGAISQLGNLSSNSSSGIFIKQKPYSRDQKMAGPDSSDDDELLTADPIDFNRFKAQIKKDEEMSSDDELPSNSHFTLPKPSQISKSEPIKDEKLSIEEEVPEPLAQVSDKIATISASDRSPHEHRPSWPCTLAQKDAQPIPLDSAHSIPAPMARFLRSYQVDGARFLFENFMRGSGALLGDDMGTGKTVQTIAFFMAIMNQTGYAKDDEDRRSKECTSRRKEGERKIDPLSIGPTALLIVPATVIQNWKNEIRTWSYLNATEYGTENKDGLKKYKSGEFDLLIVSHEYARDHIDELVSPSTNFSLLVIDEAHKFKNPSSTLTQSYHKFKDQTVRFGLTGTAVQNNLDELWCLLDLLNPRSLGDGNQAWEALVEEPIKDGMKLDSTAIQRNNKAVIIDAVRTEILSTVYLRRSKAIIKDEPSFTESKIKQAKIPKAADDPSANKKRKVTSSETSNNAASRGPWAPPSRSGASTSLQSTGSSRGAEGARRELADLLAHQKEFRDRPNAEELFQFIAEKENVSIPNLDSHLHKFNKTDKQKFVSKYEKLFKQAKELARLKRRPSIESESDDEDEDQDKKQDQDSDSDDDSD